MVALNDSTVVVHRKSSTVRLSDNFTVSEFHCSCTGSLCVYTLVSMVLVNTLEILRERLGHQIMITSGFRCQAHNHKIGGAPASRHVVGMAADIVTVDRSMLEAVFSEALRVESVGAIGRYEHERILDRLHVDVRPRAGDKKALWTQEV